MDERPSPSKRGSDATMDIMGQHSVSRMRGLFDEPARYRPVPCGIANSPLLGLRTQAPVPDGR
jgi:hypothetical protein